MKNENTNEPEEPSINIVVSGEFEGMPVSKTKEGIFVGDKKISVQTCEKYELIDDGSEEENKKTQKKNIFKSAATVVVPVLAIPFSKSIAKDYQGMGLTVRIFWRNGTTSDIFVRKGIVDAIKKIFF